MTTTMRRVLVPLLATFLWAVPVTVAQDVRRQPPNVVFILADDWGWGDLGVHGHREIRTPNLDRLAQNGMRFDQFYAAASVCSPSRASFLTGLFTPRHGIHSHIGKQGVNARRNLPDFLDPSLPVLPRLLREVGYATAHFGKWHLTAPDHPSPPEPEEYGFDEYRLTLGEGSGIHLRPESLPAWNSWPDARPGPLWSAWRAEASTRIANETISFIRRHRDGPFYVQAWLYDTHGEMTPTPGQREPFAEYPEPFEVYYAAALDSDRNVGRIIAALKELGLVENTIVIFSSDNGPENIQIHESPGVGHPGPFRGRKRSGYEGGIRMPFIVHWPRSGAPAGAVDRETVIGAVDLMPTIASLSGARVPPGLDGRDMSSALSGRPIRRDAPLFWHLVENELRWASPIDVSPNLIVRDGRWKLLMHRDGSGIELYDLERSTLETDNLADTHPEVAQRLSGMLADWAQRYPVQLPEKRR